MVSETTLPLKLRSKYPELLQYQWGYCGTVLQMPDAATSIWTLPDASYLLAGYSRRGIEWYQIIYGKSGEHVLYIRSRLLHLNTNGDSIGNLQPQLPLSQWPYKDRTRLVPYLMRWEPGTIRKHRALLKRSNLHPILSPLWET